MKVAKDKVVLISYELEVDGKIMDKTTAEQPLDYIHGRKMLIQKLEDRLEGLQEGESFSLSVSPEDGYGVYDPSKITVLPKSAFEIEGVLHDELLIVGRIIPMLNQMGDVVQGTVLEVEADSVKMDFNHPLAGKTLNFTGKVESVRDATEEELSHHCCGKHGKCGHHHEEGHECKCGHHHEEGHECKCGGHHEDGEECKCGCHNED